MHRSALFFWLHNEGREHSCDANREDCSPFLRVVFYLELFWAIFPSNPAESARIRILESANLGIFVRAESAVIETSFKTEKEDRFERFYPPLGLRDSSKG